MFFFYTRKTNYAPEKWNLVYFRNIFDKKIFPTLTTWQQNESFQFRKFRKQLLLYGDFWYNKFSFLQHLKRLLNPFSGILSKTSKDKVNQTDLFSTTIQWNRV